MGFYKIYYHLPTNDTRIFIASCMSLFDEPETNL
jgi:hypothetical protein